MNASIAAECTVIEQKVLRSAGIHALQQQAELFLVNKLLEGNDECEMAPHVRVTELLEA